jgi:hypothetical protein
MPESNRDIELRVSDAPYQRVKRRLAGIRDRSASGGENKKLSIEQEHALYSYLDRLDDLNIQMCGDQIFFDICLG